MITTAEARQRIGDGVVYTPRHGASEDGVITGVGHLYVFVRYRGDVSAKATNPDDLEFLS